MPTDREAFGARADVHCGTALHGTAVHWRGSLRHGGLRLRQRDQNQGQFRIRVDPFSKSPPGSESVFDIRIRIQQGELNYKKMPLFMHIFHN